eukprot:5091905-Pyramimonas_sp.AAC.1
MTLPGDSSTCFKRGSEPSLIDFALVSHKAERRISHIAEITDVPTRPNIGQCLVINGAIQYKMIGTLALPRTFSHPKLAEPLPNPD